MTVLFTRCLVAGQLRSPMPVERDIYDQGKITPRLIGDRSCALQRAAPATNL